MDEQICDLNKPIGLFDTKPKINSESRDNKLDNTSHIEYETQSYYDPVTKQTVTRIVSKGKEEVDDDMSDQIVELAKKKLYDSIGKYMDSKDWEDLFS